MINWFREWVLKNLNLGQEGNKKVFESIILGLFIGLIMISLQILFINKPSFLGAVSFIIFFIIVISFCYFFLKKYIYQETGIEKQKNLSKQKDDNLLVKATWGLVVVTFLLVFIGIQQYFLLKEVSIPNHAELIFNVIKTKDQNIPTFDWSEIKNGGEISIYIANTGRISTGDLDLIQWEENNWIDTTKTTVTKKDYPNLFRIESGSVSSTILVFIPKEKKVGKQTLKLRYQCTFCKKSIAYFEIPICIYDENEGVYYNSCKN